MNLLQLVLKNMRQRLLATILTTLSVMLGVALALAILVANREGQKTFAQTDYGYGLIVGPKASEVQLVLNTVYHLYKSPGTIPYDLYEDIATNRATSADGKRNPYRGFTQWAVPMAVGDTWRGRRIVGTTPQLFGVDDEGGKLPAEKTPQYRKERAYEFAEGRAFHPRKFEAVIGADVAASEKLKIGDTFHATHGNPGADEIPDVHDEKWTVVGILKATGTPNDRVLFIPLQTFYAIQEHEEGLEAIDAIKTGEARPAASVPAPKAPKDPADEHHDEHADEHPDHHKAYKVNADGTIEIELPKDKWEISAILVQPRSAFTSNQLINVLRNRPEAVAVSPAAIMAEFFSTFLKGSITLLLVISALVTVVAGVGILVSIYNAISSRNREIAVLRALGATKKRILAIVCLEATLIGLMGSVLGLLLAHGLAAVGASYMESTLATQLAWWHVDSAEVLYVAGAVALSFVAGLIPALKAYQTPVATNLS